MIKRTCIVFLCFCAVPVLLSAFNSFVMPTFDMLQSTALLEQKTSRLVQKASNFDQEKILQGLTRNSKNNFYFNFTDNISLATIERPARPHAEQKPAPASFSFEFGDNEELALEFHGSSYTIANGICSIKAQPEFLVTNTKELALLKNSLAAIEIRVKTGTEGKLLLGLSSNPEALWHDRDKTVKQIKAGHFVRNLKDICTIPVSLIADDDFHIYTVNLEKTLALGHVTFGEKLKKFFLSQAETTGAEIEIDYIRFVTKKEKFGSKPCGVSYTQKDREMRNVLYMSAPCRLRYTLTIPDGASYLSFGTGILEPRDPVDFKISITSGTLEKTLFHKTENDPGSWTHTKLNLSEYAREEVAIIFSVSSRQGNIAFWSNPTLHTPVKEKFNVIFVLEDALRPSNLTPYGYDIRPTSPFLEKLARRGTLFKYAFSQATATRPSCPSFMTSLYPTAAGAGLHHEALSERYLTLAEAMQSQGYATAAIMQNSNAGYYNGLHQGFGRMYDLEDVKTSTADIYGSQLGEWLDAVQDRNFFLYLHIIDPHGPFNPPPPFDTWYRQTELTGEKLPTNPALDPEWLKTPTRAERIALYDGAIRNNDHWLETFDKMLAARNLQQNTLIVFFSDHGEYLGERNTWAHQPPGYIQGIHVPLIMVYPEKIPRETIIEKPVQLIDLMPTVLDLAAIDKEPLVLQGDSLLTLIQEPDSDFWNKRICFSEEIINRGHNKFDNRPFGSLISDNWHILNSLNFVPGRLRNRHTGVEPLFSKAFNYTNDPEESNHINVFYFDLPGKFAASYTVEKFHESNKQLYEAFSAPPKKVIMSDPTVQENLRALGYIQ